MEKAGGGGEGEKLMGEGVRGRWGGWGRQGRRREGPGRERGGSREEQDSRERAPDRRHRSWHTDQEAGEGHSPADSFSPAALHPGAPTLISPEDEHHATLAHSSVCLSLPLPLPWLHLTHSETALPTPPRLPQSLPGPEARPLPHSRGARKAGLKPLS